MISFEEACEMTSRFYNEAWEIDRLVRAVDLGERWLIYPAVDALFGVTFYSISKEDGSMEPFVLPDSHNFELLDKAVEIDVPDKFLPK